MFKRLFYKLILLTLVAMLVAPFILKRENGTTIMSVDEFLNFDTQLIAQRYQQALAIVSNFLSDDMEIETLKEQPFNEKITKLYKWQDENGEWHFSDVKDERFQQEEVQIHNDRNVLKFQDLPAKEQDNSNTTRKKPSDTKSTPEINNESLIQNQDDGIIKGYLNNMKSTVQSAREVQAQVDADYQRKALAIDGNP